MNDLILHAVKCVLLDCSAECLHIFTALDMYHAVPVAHHCGVNQMKNGFANLNNPHHCYLVWLWRWSLGNVPYGQLGTALYIATDVYLWVTWHTCTCKHVLAPLYEMPNWLFILLDKCRNNSRYSWPSLLPWLVLSFDIVVCCSGVHSDHLLETQTQIFLFIVWIKKFSEMVEGLIVGSSCFLCGCDCSYGLWHTSSMHGGCCCDVLDSF